LENKNPKNTGQNQILGSGILPEIIMYMNIHLITHTINCQANLKLKVMT
jgi:hypothetical protein